MSTSDCHIRRPVVVTGEECPLRNESIVTVPQLQPRVLETFGFDGIDFVVSTCDGVVTGIQRRALVGDIAA